MKHVLFTGASGFIGSAAVRLFRQKQHQVRCLAHSAWDPHAPSSLSDALRGVDVIVHLAGRAHIFGPDSEESAAKYQTANVYFPQSLAIAAIEASVRRFVFVSSIGVHGDEQPDSPISETSDIRPATAYAYSKWQGESAVREIGTKYGMEVVVVRPALVYGPGVKGNFAKLLKLVSLGAPLPLASIANSRSFLGVDNLCELLSLCAFSEAAANETFVVADPECISTPNLIRTLARGLGKSARLWPLDPNLLMFLAGLTGLERQMRQLSQSLRVDSTHARDVLAWRSEKSLEAGLVEMAYDFRMKGSM